MSAIVLKKEQAVEPRIGEQHAAQPLSGVSRVDASLAVNGLGHGAFVRIEKTERAKGA